MNEQQAYRLLDLLGTLITMGSLYCEEREDGEGWLIRVLDDDGNDLAVIFDGEAIG